MFYSNCLFEALKAKIKDPKHVEIILVPPSLNHGSLHFFWKKQGKIFHFTNKNLKRTKIWFNGEIKQYDMRSFVGSILCRLQSKNYSIKKCIRIANNLKLNLSADEIKEELEV